MKNFILSLVVLVTFTNCLFAQKGTTNEEVAAAKLAAYNAYESYSDAWSNFIVKKNVAISNIDAAIIDLQAKIVAKPNFATSGQAFINELNELKNQVNTAHSAFLTEMTIASNIHENRIELEQSWYIRFFYTDEKGSFSFDESIDLIYNAAYNQPYINATSAQKFQVMQNNVNAKSKTDAGTAAINLHIVAIQALLDDIDEVIECYNTAYPNF